MTINLPTPKLSIPKVPKIVNKRVLLVSLAVLLLLAIVSFAIVQTQRAKTERAATEARVALEQKAADDKVAAQIKGLENQVETSEAKRKAVCDYTVALSKARQTRGLVTTPALPCQ